MSAVGPTSDISKPPGVRYPAPTQAPQGMVEAPGKPVVSPQTGAPAPTPVPGMVATPNAPTTALIPQALGQPSPVSIDRIMAENAAMPTPTMGPPAPQGPPAPPTGGLPRNQTQTMYQVYDSKGNLLVSTPNKAEAQNVLASYNAAQQAAAGAAQPTAPGAKVQGAKGVLAAISMGASDFFQLPHALENVESLLWAGAAQAKGKAQSTGNVLYNVPGVGEAIGAEFVGLGAGFLEAIPFTQSAPGKGVVQQAVAGNAGFFENPQNVGEVVGFGLGLFTGAKVIGAAGSVVAGGLETVSEGGGVGAGVAGGLLRVGSSTAGRVAIGAGVGGGLAAAGGGSPESIAESATIGAVGFGLPAIIEPISSRISDIIGVKVSTVTGAEVTSVEAGGRATSEIGLTTGTARVSPEVASFLQSISGQATGISGEAEGIVVPAPPPAQFTLVERETMNVFAGLEAPTPNQALLGAAEQVTARVPTIEAEFGLYEPGGLSVFEETQFPTRTTVPNFQDVFGRQPVTRVFSGLEEGSPYTIETAGQKSATLVSSLGLPSEEAQGTITRATIGAPKVVYNLSEAQFKQAQALGLIPKTTEEVPSPSKLFGTPPSGKGPFTPFGLRPETTLPSEMLGGGEFEAPTAPPTPATSLRPPSEGTVGSTGGGGGQRLVGVQRTAGQMFQYEDVFAPTPPGTRISLPPALFEFPAPPGLKSEPATSQDAILRFLQVNLPTTKEVQDQSTAALVTQIFGQGQGTGQGQGQGQIPGQGSIGVTPGIPPPPPPPPEAPPREPGLQSPFFLLPPAGIGGGPLLETGYILQGLKKHPINEAPAKGFDPIRTLFGRAAHGAKPGKTNNLGLPIREAHRTKAPEVDLDYVFTGKRSKKR